MADMRSFTKEFVLEFIRLYKSLPCLWKIKSKEYSDRHKKALAYSKLIGKLREQIPNADRTMVVKKLDSIRGSFRKEWKKMNDYTRTGTEDIVYKPRLWYFKELTFLKGHVFPKPRDPTMIDSFKTEKKSTHEFCPPPSSPKEQTSTINSPALSVHTYCKKRSSNSNDFALKTTNENLGSGGQEEYYDVVANNLDIVLKKVNQKLDSKRHDDYYGVFGKHLANKLRKLPEEVATVTEKLVLDLVYEAELGYVDRRTKLQLNQPDAPAPEHSEEWIIGNTTIANNGQVGQHNVL